MNAGQWLLHSWKSGTATRLGDLKKFMVNHLRAEVAKKIGDFWAILKTSILSKDCCGYFLGNFWKNWATICSNMWSHWLPVRTINYAQPKGIIVVDVGFHFSFYELPKARMNLPHESRKLVWAKTKFLTTAKWKVVWDDKTCRAGWCTLVRSSVTRVGDFLHFWSLLQK